MKKHYIIMLSLIVVVLFSSFAGAKDEVVLRVATGIDGPEEVAISDKVVAEFNEQHPDVKVEWDRSTGEDYQFTGLPSLLESDTPPDVYFEWGGDRVLNHVIDEEALAISDLAEEMKSFINESAWSGGNYDGEQYLIPYVQDVTIMLWYNKDIFDRLNLQEPATWDEFLKVCQALKDNNITPILMGNADAWVTGNFGGLFFSRWAGEEKTHKIFSLEEGTALNDPDFVKALEFAYKLAEQGFVNDDMNTLGYEESFARLFNESSAMYPLGTWFRQEVIAEFAPDPEKANFDFFNLPPFPEGKGEPGSIMGLNTGFVVNRNTEHKDLAYDFLRIYMQAKYQEEFMNIGRIVSHKDVLTAATDAYTLKVVEMLNSTPAVVAPPDTGYNLEMAAALYEAIAKVFVNLATPQEALDVAENKIRHLR